MSATSETLAIFIGTDTLLATSILGAQILLPKIRKAVSATPQPARATAEPASPVALASTIIPGLAEPQQPMTPATERPACPYCGSSSVNRRGMKYWPDGTFRQYVCKNDNCRRWFPIPFEGAQVVPIGRAS